MSTTHQPASAQVCAHTRNANTAHSEKDTQRRRGQKYTVELDEEDESNEYTDQIEKDTARSMHCWSVDDEDLANKRAALRRILVKAIAQSHGTKHYFQGLNDVASVLYFALGEVQAVRALDWLMHHTLALWFEPSLPPLVAIMSCIPHLLRLAAPSAYAVLCACDSGTRPDFALSWVTTWFAHNTRDIAALYQLFDVLFDTPSGDATAVVYLAAEVIKQCLARVPENQRPKDMCEATQFFAAMPPIATREHAKQQQQQGSCLVVEDIISGAKDMMSKWSWDSIKMDQHVSQMKVAQKRITFATVVASAAIVATIAIGAFVFFGSS